VKALIQDPSVARVEGTTPMLIEKEYESFYVDARAAGRGRIRAATVEEAKLKGLPVAKEIAAEGASAIELSPQERLIYVAAAKILKPFGLAVDEAARKLSEILKKLDGESFDKVHEGYSAGRQELKTDGKTTEIYELYLHEQEEVRGNSEYQVRDVKRWVGGFVGDFPGRIIPITPEQIKGWLGKRGKKARSKNNARNHIRAFFNFAQKNDYLPQGIPHAAQKVTPFKDKRKVISTEEEAQESVEKIEFYTPDESRRLLDAASEELRVTLEFKGFSGIRTEEMVRFWWVFAKGDQKVIQIPREIAKLKFRTIPIVENFQKRLAVYSPEIKKGRVCKEWASANALYHAWLRLCAKAGVAYKKNAFRDSYITYRVALTNDPKLVAMESGNSEKMIRENYLHLTTREQALEWFSL
jgi:integrase